MLLVFLGWLYGYILPRSHVSILSLIILFIPIF